MPRADALTAGQVASLGEMARQEPKVMNVSLRRMPFPYKSMLAICSDLDETPDRHVYRQIMRFLNTTDTTCMGPGVGLEVGNSIYFDMPPDQFAYWNTDEAGRATVREFIQSGHVDVLHSYGELATTRGDAERALEELDRYGCRLRVWVDHSTAASNFGADIMRGQGDVPGSPVYHADVTTAHGVRYVWRGRVTSITGQDVPARLAGIFDGSHPFASGRTLAKEAAKRVLARLGNGKYSLHGPNRVLRADRLRDGRPVYEFLRCNPYWGDVGGAATAAGIAEVLTESFLNRLVDREGICVLYTHLGKIANRDEPFAEPARSALQRLARYHHDHKVLVTTTYRLLRYLRVRDSLRYRAERVGQRLMVTIERLEDSVLGTARPSLDDIQGITLVATGREEVEVSIHGGASVDCETTRSGEVAHVVIPWERLVLPDS